MAQQSQAVRLEQVEASKAGDAKSDIDIIAIHGLDTKSPDTWIWRSKDRKKSDINWLADSHMLPSQVERARIFTCDWPADLLQDSDSTPWTVEEFARRLLAGIQNMRRHSATDFQAKDRPILFIASCLGGIILMKALVMADNPHGEYISLRKATRAIVFLATPFRGTAFQDIAAWAEPMLKAWASLRNRSVTQLLDSVKGSTFDLEELVRTFTRLCQDKYHPCQVHTFYEKRVTVLQRKFLPACLLPLFGQAKLLVNSSSATLDIVPEPLPLERRHVMMNKFFGPEDPDYDVISRKIQAVLQAIREGSLLKKADDYIRYRHYTADRLAIVRLSGDRLPMDQCYINLAIVEQPGEKADRSDTARSSPFSLFARQKIETPDEKVQVNISTIFSPRHKSDGRTTQPRRILIRGRAGVGKTTLCKRIVYDFICHGTWTELFDRLLWVPLRNLKGRSAPGYNHEDLFYHEYFSGQGHDNGRHLAGELWRSLQETYGSRTLFILDGLDEISELLDPDSLMSNFLQDLLNQPNVIITSRPNASLPALRNLDLELETIGFYPHQVKAYLDADPKIKSRANEVQSWLQEHWLIQGLVRIPIQLDALCYTWEDFDSGTQPDSMTGIYQAIEQKLWKKDVLRLEKKHDGERVTHSQIGTADVEDLVKHEIYFLEGLAFTGLHNDVIDFTSQHRGAISKHFRHRGILLDKTFPRLSFLRTSDDSLEGRNGNYHFLHLTFQEYFAARYFVQQWTTGEQLLVLYLDSQQERTNAKDVLKINAEEYLRKEKYNARYDIFWRFVTGLLYANHDQEQLCHFFRAIEDQPRDLLGPVHQRLVMHCLSEVAPLQDIPQFKQLQERLKQWLLFECTFQGSSKLAAELEFPNQILEALLREESDDVKCKVLISLKEKPRISQTIINYADLWLRGNVSRELKRAALRVFNRQSALSEQAIQALVALLRDPESHVRSVAAEALGRLSALPNEIFYSFLLAIDSQSFNDLYSVWLRRSFSDHLTWYVEGKTYRINMPEGARYIPSDRLWSAVQEAQVSLNVPNRSFT